MRMGKYDCFFSDETFENERGELLKIEDNNICSCNNPDLLYCNVHNLHFAIINGNKEVVEKKGFITI